MIRSSVQATVDRWIQKKTGVRVNPYTFTNAQIARYERDVKPMMRVVSRERILLARGSTPTPRPLLWI